MAKIDRTEDVEEIADLAEAVVELLEEEGDPDAPDLDQVILDALARQNVFNVEVVSAMAALSAGKLGQSQFDALTKEMRQVHQAVMDAVSLWAETKGAEDD
ncbi:hypothetical protein FJU08_16600 [Martelella alba]|uniref:Uncharacterized protein n=1 Tax=Martelella alba TaxID=2590451 RepID=A0A506U9D2_9HYPH|nr:hypothetical protein [Martelella alba]TPW28437.1 hypothetical protein FJU08_16600 [Martelella alba]